METRGHMDRLLRWRDGSPRLVATMTSVHGVPAVLPRGIRDAGAIIAFARKHGAILPRQNKAGNPGLPYFCIEFDCKSGPRLFTAEELHQRLEARA